MCFDQTWVCCFRYSAPLRVLAEVAEYQIEQFSPKLTLLMVELNASYNLIFSYIQLGN